MFWNWYMIPRWGIQNAGRRGQRMRGYNKSAVVHTDFYLLFSSQVALLVEWEKPCPVGIAAGRILIKDAITSRQQVGTNLESRFLDCGEVCTCQGNVVSPYFNNRSSCAGSASAGTAFLPSDLTTFVTKERGLSDWLFVTLEYSGCLRILMEAPSLSHSNGKGSMGYPCYVGRIFVSPLAWACCLLWTPHLLFLLFFSPEKCRLLIGS